MAKGSKFWPSLLSSFSCRPTDTLLVHTPLPKASYLLSPVYSDVSFPTPLSPPPSTPTLSQSNNDFEASSINALECKRLSKSSRMHKIPSELTSRKYHVTKEKMYNDPNISSYSDEGERSKTKIQKPRASVSNDTLHFSSPSKSNGLLKTCIEENQEEFVRKSVRTRRFKRFGSKEWKYGVIGGKPVSGSLAPTMVDVGVNRSFVMVKKSVNPYEDFKKSMMEMILEKQMSNPKELEELLKSFLSLNSRMHHQVIIEAFTDIWKEVQCGRSSNSCA